MKIILTCMNSPCIAHLYRRLRLETLRQVQADYLELLPDFINRVNLTEITETALLYQEMWHQPLERQVGWNWRVIRDQYRRNYPARVEVAVWYDNQLCGLMLGKASEGRLVVKINYMQGNGLKNPIKGHIVPISSRCAELFAIAIEADWIGIQDPLDEDELLKYYRELGFDQPDPFDPRNKALFKRITDEQRQTSKHNIYQL
ncbi:hypothetical protein [Vibrio sp. SCSIO 43137]|uniref:hypothetical protein n=1 Tax=Vibrio sp. SCSIO 43137 TaxID=3021011 RepID=UPI00230800EB|nr:hypothetical protein [Vibrio sp. SCSIO 43137]WCE31326.1 hypothetical protein PK654_19485 [Vibrio sp. SCSIO 43137]